MKKLLALLCAAGMALALAACGGGEQTTTAAPGETTTAAENITTTTAAPAAGATIKIPPPAGWTPNEDTVILAQYMKSTASFMAKTENVLAGKDLDAMADEAKAQLSGSFENVKYEGGNEKIKVGGKDAVKFTWTGVVASMNFKYVYIYIPAGSNVYSLTFGDLVESFDTNVTPDIDTILDSITFE